MKKLILSAVFILVLACSSIGASTSGMQIIIDSTTTANTIYIGMAQSKETTASSYWQIIAITTANGIQTICYANNSAQFGFSWDKRTTYTYTTPTNQSKE